MIGQTVLLPRDGYSRKSWASATMLFGPPKDAMGKPAVVNVNENHKYLFRVFFSTDNSGFFKTSL